ncbi:biopolymer transporter ExbD [Pararhodobacter marinus]|uniref:Biopolymer transporter ExbD n=1 Tax=Pararhodobacter marinus TaxID=2184063 RepID=A0A2U2C9V0_9RHOB|nr:biopolymer transporter ExbD [Pararhodobacter marinus]PWE28665.1 biopolymer transporter ExbD [Pararhodobacter marinus]
MTELVAPRRRSALSLTSLIDVIFLLLLFFMLTSTFTRLGELDLTPGAPGGSQGQAAPVFVQLAPGDLRVNAETVPLDGLARHLTPLAGEDGMVLIALGEGVDAQRLVDVLAALRGAAFRIRVLP